MTSAPGTYALLLECRTPRAVRIGRLGLLRLAPGRFLYVGSAFGPGGLRARLARHFRRVKPKRWHVDYLRGCARVVGAWYTLDPRRLEHRWASRLAGEPGLTAVPGFGCSDCRCASHLFFGTRIEPPAPFQGGGREAVGWLPYGPVR